MEDNNTRQVLNSLMDQLRKTGISEDRYVVPAVRSLKQALRENREHIDSDVLRSILGLTDSIRYFVKVSSKGAGCWEGTTFTTRSQREESLADIKQMARQELLRRGEPEEDHSREPSRDDKLDVQAALKHWKRKCRLKSAGGKQKLIQKISVEQNRERALKLLAGALSDEDPGVRIAAVKRAGMLKPVPFPLLVLGAGGEDLSVIHVAIKILGDLKTAEAAGLIGSIARRNTDRQIRNQAITALAAIRKPESTVILTDLYGRVRTPMERIQIIKAIACTGGPTAIQFLTKALADSKEEIRAEALESLEPYGEAIVQDALTASLKLVEGPAAEENLALLAKKKDPSVIALIEPLLNSTDSEKRIRGIELLELNGTPEASLRFIEMMNDPCSPVRKKALQAVSDFHSVKCRMALEEVLHNEDNEMARLAASALLRIHDVSIPPILEKALGHHDEEVRYAAAAGLLERNRFQGLKILEELLESRNGPLREKITHLLMEKGGDSGAVILARHLVAAGGTMEQELTRFFTKKKCPEAIDPLVKIWKETEGETKKQAAQALKNQGWQPKNLGLAREFWQLTGDTEAMAKAGLPDAVGPLKAKAMSTSSPYEMMDICRSLANISDPLAVNALADIMNKVNYTLTPYPAKTLVKLNRAPAYICLVDHIFAPGSKNSVEDILVKEGRGGEIAYIIGRTRNPLQAERAVKLLERIIRKRPDSLSNSDLVMIASLLPRAMVMKSTEEACKTVLRPTGQTRQMDCATLRQLAKQELASRKQNG